MPSVEANIASTLVVALPISHDFLWPPMPLKNAITMEIPTPQRWIPGYYNKLSQTVFHQYMPVALKEHDVGILIVHISAPFPNALNILQTLNSARSIFVFSSTVNMEGQGVGCAGLLAIPPITMNQCGDMFSMPISISMNFTNTLVVGFSWADFFMGLARLAVDALFTLLFNKILRTGNGVHYKLSDVKLSVGKISPAILKEAFKLLKEEVVNNFITKGQWKKQCIKMAFDSGAGLVNSLLTDGNPTVTVGRGMRVLGADVYYDGGAGEVGARGRVGNVEGKVAW